MTILCNNLSILVGKLDNDFNSINMADNNLFITDLCHVVVCWLSSSFYNLQEERSLLTGPQIILEWLSVKGLTNIDLYG